MIIEFVSKKKCFVALKSTVFIVAECSQEACKMFRPTVSVFTPLEVTTTRKTRKTRTTRENVRGVDYSFTMEKTTDNTFMYTIRNWFWGMVKDHTLIFF